MTISWKGYEILDRGPAKRMGRDAGRAPPALLVTRPTVSTLRAPRRALLYSAPTGSIWASCWPLCAASHAPRQRARHPDVRPARPAERRRGGRVSLRVRERGDGADGARGRRAGMGAIVDGGGGADAGRLRHGQPGGVDGHHDPAGCAPEVPWAGADPRPLVPARRDRRADRRLACTIRAARGTSRNAWCAVCGMSRLSHSRPRVSRSRGAAPSTSRRGRCGWATSRKPMSGRCTRSTGGDAAEFTDASMRTGAHEEARPRAQPISDVTARRRRTSTSCLREPRVRHRALPVGTRTWTGSTSATSGWWRRTLRSGSRTRSTRKCCPGC